MTTATTSTTSTAQVFEHFLGDFYSRRLLLHTALNPSPQITPSQSPPGSSSFHDSSEPNYTGDNTFDANVVMVLSVLLCALICSSGLNSIIRCTLRCCRLVSTGSSTDLTPSTRLANTGVKRKALKTYPTITYSTGLSLPGLDTECVICLSEFAAGERVRLLPKCNHCFHVRCIDKWLSSHSSCPTCRHCLTETCQKIVGSSSTSQSPAPVQELRIVTIVPLEPEGLIRNYSEGN